MGLLEAALTVTAVTSTWIATTLEEQVRLPSHVWGDSIFPLFLHPWRTLQEWGFTASNTCYPLHSDNCSACLFASEEDGSLVLIGQKLPHTNYSQFKLLLLPKESRTIATAPSISESRFRWYSSHSQIILAVAVVMMVVWSLITSLRSRPKHSLIVANETTLADGRPMINDNGNKLVAGAQENQKARKPLLKWPAASPLRWGQNLYFLWEQHFDNRQLEGLCPTTDETVEGDRQDNDGDGPSTAQMDEDRALEEDYELEVVNLESKIEQSLTDAALKQKRIALIKEKDLEIESLRKKLDFTTGKFRDFQKEHEECRIRSAFHETK